MSALPIACTLNAEDMAAVKARYQQATDLYEASAWIAGAHADVYLQGEKPPIKALLDEMIVRELSCCSFLTFVVTEVEDGYRVQLRMGAEHDLQDAILRDAVETFFPTTAVTVR